MYPTLTTAERDRRWSLARAFMDDHQLEGVVFTSGGTRIGRYRHIGSHYLSNEPEGTVILPRHGDPVLLSTRNRWGLIQTDVRQGVLPWIDDVRLAEPMVPTIANAVRERGLATARLGVITGGGETPYGSLADPFWQAIATELPDVEAVDVASTFIIATLPKSGEEMALARAAARAGSRAALAMVEAAGSGVCEVELYAAAAAELARGGVDSQVFLMTVGPETMGFGMPRWLFPNRPPRLLSQGDVILAELFPTYGGVDVQQQLTIVVGEPAAEIVRLAEVARAAYDAGLAALRAGVTFGSVYEAMVAPISAAGCWDADPMVHSLPIKMGGATHTMLDGRADVDETMVDLEAIPGRLLDAVLGAGTLLAFEPMPALGRHRAMVGGTVVALEDGCEELSTAGATVHFVD